MHLAVEITFPFFRHVVPCCRKRHVIARVRSAFIVFPLFANESALFENMLNIRVKSNREIVARRVSFSDFIS